MIITISGLSGSGKSTIAKLLSKKLNYESFDAGKAQRELAMEKNISLIELNRLEEKDPKFDYLIDQKLINRAKNNKNIILEGRISGWMCYQNNIKAFKIWIECPLNIRIKRIARREKKNILTTTKETVFREKSENLRYKKYYNIDRSNLSIYDLVVDSSNNLPYKIIRIILNKLKEKQWI